MHASDGVPPSRPLRPACTGCLVLWERVNRKVEERAKGPDAAVSPRDPEAVRELVMKECMDTDFGSMTDVFQPTVRGASPRWSRRPSGALTPPPPAPPLSARPFSRISTPLLTPTRRGMP